MNTSEFIASGVCLLAASGVTAGALALRKAASHIVWNGYTIRWSFEVKPPLPRKPLPPAVAATPAAAAEAPEPAAAAPELTALPEGATLTRQEAAALLGVAEVTLRRNARNWGLAEIDGRGRATRVTAESVRRYLEARESAPPGKHLREVS